MNLTIISGGQAGADRAALDFAIAQGIPHAGWCPKGRKAEDGPIDPHYKLQETPRADYLQRTEWNVRDSDGTVVFSIGPLLTGGSKRTVELARRHGKPCLHVSAQGGRDKAQELLRKFIHQHGIILDVDSSTALETPADFSSRRTDDRCPESGALVVTSPAWPVLPVISPPPPLATGQRLRACTVWSNQSNGSIRKQLRRKREVARGCLRWFNSSR